MNKQWRVSRCVIVMQKPWIVSPQFRAFLPYWFTQTVHYFKVILLINRTTLWKELLMHYAMIIKENIEQNLDIWQNLTCFFRSRWFSVLPLGRLCFGFIVITIYPWFFTSYDPFKQIWIVVNVIQHFLSDGLIVIRRFSITIFFTASVFSLVVDVLGRPERASSFTSSRPSVKSLYHL